MRDYIINYTYKNKKLFFLNGLRKRLSINTLNLILANMYDNEKFINTVYNLTEFCDSTTPVHSRLNLIYNNITSLPKCPICGNNVKIQTKATHLNNILNKTCENPLCAKTIAGRCVKVYDSTIEKHKIFQSKVKAEEKLTILNLKKIYESNKFTLKSKDETQKYFINLISKRHKNGIIVKLKHIINDCDYIASLLYYTSYIKTEILSYKTLNISERIYALLNDISEYPKCKFCGKEISKFIDLKNGYIESCPKCAADKNRLTLNLKTSSQIKDSIKINYDILEFPTNLSIDKAKLRCKTCNNEFYTSFRNGRGQYIDINTKLCPNCRSGNSQEEDSLFNYIKSIYSGKIHRHDRNIIEPLELDIVLDDLNIAIEYDGLYWHNSTNIKSTYHLLKTNFCNNKGIRLIHIFEDEWNYKRNIVKSRLKHIICKTNNRKIYARNCIVKEITTNEKNIFLTKYHIQGQDSAKIKYGLFYKNRLVAVMTFVKSRFNKNYEYELCRYATISNFTIIGGAGKLLKYFERTHKPTSLVSYADRRWSNGNLYKCLGFNLLRKSQPNYWYIKGDKRYHRIGFQKNKLSKIFTTFNPSLTEEQNMKLAGYDRIYDCGNLVFIKEF